MNHSIAGSERNSVLSFHSEPGWVVERTHCVVEAFPGAAFTQIDTQSSSWRLCVCYLVLPASLAIRRFTDSLAVSFPGDRPRVARQNPTRALGARTTGYRIYLCLCTDTRLLLCCHAVTLWHEEVLKKRQLFNNGQNIWFRSTFQAREIVLNFLGYHRPTLRQAFSHPVGCSVMRGTVSLNGKRIRALEKATKYCDPSFQDIYIYTLPSGKLTL